MLIKKKKKKFFCINYNTNFGSSPDPDPWSDSVCGPCSVQPVRPKKVKCGFNILLYHLVVPFKEIWTIGHSNLALQS